MTAGFIRMLVAVCAATFFSAAPAGPGAAAEREFRFGVSMYDYHLASGADYAGREYVPFVAEQFRILGENGINTIHFGISGSSREIFGKWLELAEKYGIDLVLQLDFAYWRPDLSENEQKRRAARAAGLKRYQRLIGKMEISPEAPLEALGDNLYLGAFSLPGLAGRIVVAVNAAVGEWPGSPLHFRNDDQVYIDDRGNLVGYRPFSEDRQCRFRRIDPAAGRKIFDLAGDTVIEADADGHFSLDIPPGGGRFIFLGNREEAETVRNMLD